MERAAAAQRGPVCGQPARADALPRVLPRCCRRSGGSEWSLQVPASRPRTRHPGRCPADAPRAVCKGQLRCPLADTIARAHFARRSYGQVPDRISQVPVLMNVPSVLSPCPPSSPRISLCPPDCGISQPAPAPPALSPSPSCCQHWQERRQLGLAARDVFIPAYPCTAAQD